MPQTHPVETGDSEGSNKMLSGHVSECACQCRDGCGMKDVMRTFDFPLVVTLAGGLGDASAVLACDSAEELELESPV